MRAEIHIKFSRILVYRIEYSHLKSLIFKNSLEVLAGSDCSSKIVIHELHFNTFCNLSKKYFMHFIPQCPLGNYKEINKYKFFGFLKVFKYIFKNIFTHRIIGYFIASRKHIFLSRHIFNHTACHRIFVYIIIYKFFISQ